MPNVSFELCICEPSEINICTNLIYSKNTDESIDECRRVQTNVEECRRIKNFYFDSRKSDTWSHFLIVAIMAQKATSGMQIFNFIVLCYYCYSILYNLPICPLNVRELKLNQCSKAQSRQEAPCVGDGSTALLTKPSDLLKGAPSLYTGMRLPNAV